MVHEVGHAALALWPPLYYMVLQPPLTVFITVNIVIAVLNLLPIAPLDGARAWRAVPLLLHWLTPRIKTLPHDLADTLNVKKRHAMQKESARLAAQLLERLNKK